MEAASGDIDALFAELDATLEASREQTLAPLLPRLVASSRLREDADFVTAYALHSREQSRRPRPGDAGPSTSSSAAAAASTSGRAAAPGGAGAGRGAAAVAAAQPAEPPVDWDGILERVFGRDESECAICLGDLRRRVG